MNIDFNAIYEILAPYLGSTGIATAIISTLILVLKASASIKSFSSSFKNTNKMIEDGIKKVIPEQMYVKIEGVAKEEFAKMRAQLEQDVNDKWLSQIKANTDLMQAIAMALCSMKAIPDSQKEIISNMLDVKPQTTEALVIDIIPQEEIKKVSKKQKIVIE